MLHALVPHFPSTCLPVCPSTHPLPSARPSTAVHPPIRCHLPAHPPPSAHPPLDATPMHLPCPMANGQTPSQEWKKVSPCIPVAGSSIITQWLNGNASIVSSSSMFFSPHLCANITSPRRLTFSFLFLFFSFFSSSSSLLLCPLSAQTTNNLVNTSTPTLLYPDRAHCF